MTRVVDRVRPGCVVPRVRHNQRTYRSRLTCQSSFPKTLTVCGDVCQLGKHPEAHCSCRDDTNPFPTPNPFPTHPRDRRRTTGAPRSLYPVLRRPLASEGVRLDSPSHKVGSGLVSRRPGVSRGSCTDLILNPGTRGKDRPSAGGTVTENPLDGPSTPSLGTIEQGPLVQEDVDPTSV